MRITSFCVTTTGAAAAAAAGSDTCCTGSEPIEPFVLLSGMSSALTLQQ